MSESKTPKGQPGFSYLGPKLGPHTGDPLSQEMAKQPIEYPFVEGSADELLALSEHDEARIAAQDSTIRSLERQVTELTAKLAEKEREIDETKAELAGVRDWLGQVEHYAGSQMLMSDFQTADHLRDAYKAVCSQLAEARKDSERIEKLRWYVVNVRQPMRHGSLNIFYANPGDGDEEDVTPSDLREQIDALPPAPSNPTRKD